eukprot:8053414-Alexandrium_andersonii.AAC.1
MGQPACPRGEGDAAGGQRLGSHGGVSDAGGWPLDLLQLGLAAPFARRIRQPGTLARQEVLLGVGALK